MSNDVIWFKREFEFILPPEMYAIQVERLRGTPARLEEKVANIPNDVLIQSEGEKWSVKQSIGHMIVCFDLWDPRIVDFKNREKELHPADLNNTKSKETNFNDQPLAELVKQFRAKQENLVKEFESFSDDDAALSAFHPRLQKPMRLIDLAYFIAEHDDHHLACMTDLIRKYSK
ncbi:MAG: DinB family protein [candidate division Zixibacteria bacterium]|nr:DinB family protein [candidate division Zixibacteria bacterium]